MTSPAGTNGDVQFNKNRRFGADTGHLSYSTATHTLSASKISVSTITINGQTYTFPSLPGAGGTFARNDGAGGITWEPPVTLFTSTGVALGIFDNDVQITSPTAGINFQGTQFVVSLQGTTTAFVQLNTSSVTLLGPLVSLSSEVEGSLPAASIAAGSLGASVLASSIAVGAVTDSAIVSVAGSKVTGDIPGNAAGITGTVNVDQVVGAASIYPATATASFPFGLSGSTAQVNGSQATWFPGGSYSGNPLLKINGSNALGTYFSEITFGNTVFSNFTTHGRFGTIGAMNSNSGSNNGGFYFVGPTDVYTANINSTGLHILTSNGVNALDVAGGVLIGSTFTALGTVRTGILPQGSYAPLSGLGVQGVVVLGTTTVITSTASLQIFSKPSNTYALYISTAITGGKVVAISTSSEVLLNGSAGTSGQVLTSAGAGAIPTWTTPSAGGGGGDSFGSHIATQTVTAGQGVVTTTVTATAFNSTSSSFTVTGSMAVSGSGDGQIILTISGSTYTVAASSIIPAVGSYAIYTSTWGTLGAGASAGGGTPGTPVRSVQFNSAGAFAGSSSFNWSGTSMSVHGQIRSSTMSVLTGAEVTGNSTPGLLDIYAGDMGSGTGQKLLSLGTNQQTNQVIFPDRAAVDMTRYGANIGGLRVGRETNLQKIYSDQAITQYWELWNSGLMEFKTATVANGGKDIIFYPNQVETVRISSTSGVVVRSSVTILGGGNTESGLGISNGKLFVQASTAAAYSVLVGTSPTLSSTNYSLAMSSWGVISIKGVRGDINAPDGDYGQWVSSYSAQAISMTGSQQLTDIAAVSLTAGDWELNGYAVFLVNGATISGNTELAMSTTAGNSATGLNSYDNVADDRTLATGSATNITMAIPGWRLALNAPATAYLKAYVTYSAGTPQAQGRITARRMH